MGFPSTPLAAAQFAALDQAARNSLLAEVFVVLEYGGPDDPPGVEWSSDTTEDIAAAFNRHGVVFTDPNELPNGYRFNDHQRQGIGNGRCRYSLAATIEPNQRHGRSVRCPIDCPDSTTEVDPDAPTPEDLTNEGGVIYFAGLCNQNEEPMTLRDGRWSCSDGHDGTCVPIPGTVAYAHVWDADDAAARRLGTWHLDHPRT